MKLRLTETIVLAIFAIYLLTQGCFSSRMGRGLDVLNSKIPRISFERTAYVDAVAATFFYAKQIGDNYCLEISTRSDFVIIEFGSSGRMSDNCKLGTSDDNRLQSPLTCEFRDKTVREILESISRQAKFDGVIMKVREAQLNP